jgi:hypothetical protein
MTALPHPAKVNQKVPMASAAYFFAFKALSPELNRVNREIKRHDEYSAKRQFNNPRLRGIPHAWKTLRKDVGAVRLNLPRIESPAYFAPQIWHHLGFGYAVDRPGL